MKKVIDLGYGRQTLYEMYSKTTMSSRLQYGLVQLESKYNILHWSLEKPTIIGTLKNNIKTLMSYDVLFMCYFYPQPLFFLSLLRMLGLFKHRKIVVISHVTLIPGRNILECLFLRLVYGTIDKVLFHSPKNLDESVERGLIDRKKAEFLFWGDDLEYVDHFIQPKNGGFFLSTGREQRDFHLLVTVFSRCDAKLELFTNKVNYDNNYEYLTEMIDRYPNVKIHFVEKSPETTHFLAQQLADCLCVVIPLLYNERYYCVGLTSIIEAMAMGKPIVTSRNPYYPIDIEKEGIGLVADDELSWIEAVDFIMNHKEEAKQMGVRARKLAERMFNINECARQIDHIFNE